ncbi:MAG TPA: glycoside hydrolase family 2, partial [Phycisphaerae bacterium]|nr:glycoside hydrolase family 2 [Phycisphaerae bacterium]
GDAPRQWKVAYAAGTLRAVAKNKGAEAAREEIRTAGKAAKLVLVAEKARLPNDFDDVCYVRAMVTDENGVVNPNAVATVKFAVSGPGAVIATDNGDVASHEAFQSPERSTWQGTCVAIVRATADSGKITLTASADGLANGTVSIDAATPAR